MTRLDLARALVRPIGGYAIIAAMIGLVAAIVIATFTDFDATIAAGALVPDRTDPIPFILLEEI